MTDPWDDRRKALRAVSGDRFTVPALGGGGRLYGGEVAAQALAAGQQTVADDRRLHVVQATYVRPGDPALDLSLRADRLSDGRRFAVRRVDVEQAGKVILTATMSWHTGGEAVCHQDEMPAVPGPEGLPGLADWPGRQPFWPQWIAAGVDLRPVPSDEDDPAGTRLTWCRVTAALPGDPALHASLWLYASDLTLVASIRLPHEAGTVKSWLMTSLNHSVWYHRPFRVDEWHLVVQRSPTAYAARGLAQAQVFTSDGRLVSTLTQEGMASPMRSSSSPQSSSAARES